MQLLSGHLLGMNMHETLAGHLRGTVGVEGSGRDVGVLVGELSVSNKHWNLTVTLCGLRIRKINWCLTIISAHSAFEKLAFREELLN